MAGDIRPIRSPLSVAGMVLTTISVVVFLVVFLADLFGFHTNPYLGIIFFLVLPLLFLLGLAMIPLGAWVERRRRGAGKAPTAVQWPRVDPDFALPPVVAGGRAAWRRCHSAVV